MVLHQTHQMSTKTAIISHSEADLYCELGALEVWQHIAGADASFGIDGL